MTYVTCRLTAKNRDQLRNPKLGNRVRATFTFYLMSVMYLQSEGPGGVHQGGRHGAGKAARRGRLRRSGQRDRHTVPDEGPTGGHRRDV